ncbi:MAG: hypothetical protein JWN30_2755 [Bacilli bacterium]|nr:hypothetical protein [Bacilli bacterium]
MKLVVNCILRSKEQVLLLQKPSRGWWVAPGGKVEAGETPYEAVIREFREETGLRLQTPQLRGVFTINVIGAENQQETWMLLTYYAEQYAGSLLTVSEEGHLEWTRLGEVPKRPMAEGDHFFFDHILRESTLLTGKFIYTPEYELIEWRPDHSLEWV